MHNPPSTSFQVRLVTWLLFLVSGTAAAQGKEDVYVMRNTANVAGILATYDTQSAACGTTTFDAGQYARLVVANTLDNDRLLVVLARNSAGEGMAAIRTYYCITKSNLNTYFKPKEGGTEIGVVTVPFKMRFGPMKLMAGNTIGPFIGRRFGSVNGNHSTALGFASLTNVPLNDINDDVPETKWGLGLGAGWVWSVRRDFQVGVVSGVDLFEGVEKWKYGYKPWLSLSIGYAFLNRSAEAEVLKSAR